MAAPDTSSSPTAPSTQCAYTEGGKPCTCGGKWPLHTTAPAAPREQPAPTAAPVGEQPTSVVVALHDLAAWLDEADRLIDRLAQARGIVRRNSGNEMQEDLRHLADWFAEHPAEARNAWAYVNDEDPATPDAVPGAGDEFTAAELIRAARTMDAAGVPADAGEDAVRAVALVLRHLPAPVVPGPGEQIVGELAEALARHEPQYHDGHLTGEPDFFSCGENDDSGRGCEWVSDPESEDDYATQHRRHVARAALLPVVHREQAQAEQAGYERGRRDFQFAPEGDNHHNAALCPYCSPAAARPDGLEAGR